MPNYAWSNILVADDKAGKKVIRTGDTVSKSDVGDDWDTFVEEGVIRDTEYPETRPGETAQTALLRQATEQLEAAQRGEAAPKRQTQEK